MTKVTLATLIALISLASLIDPSISILLTTDHSPIALLVIAFIVSPLVGLYAKNYSKIIRQRINQQQYQSYIQQQQRLVLKH